MYRGVGIAYPLAVKVIASVRQDADGSAKQMVATTVQLRHEDQELTALRFRLDGEGGLVADCVNNLFKELRVASAQ